MMPQKRPRDEQQAPAEVAAVAVAAEEEDTATTPSKSVRLNLTGKASPEEECKTLGAMIVGEESLSGAATAGQHLVTPALVRARRKRAVDAGEGETEGIAVNSSDPTPASRRSLFPTPAAAAAVASTATCAVVEVTGKPPAATITPSRHGALLLGTAPVVAAKRKLMFGRLVTETMVQENVRQVYRIIRKLTGGIGGNGSHGPIYGELTMGSMQKMVNLMKQHTGLSGSSRFIDVGSGIGKPSFHVAQDPGVEFSYGIEIEADRWLLGMSCLKQVLNVVNEQELQQEQEESPTTTKPFENILQHRVLFEHGDIKNAKIFDPFTHVYMFSIGFPPQLWITLSEMWNKSTSPYMICFHSPKDVIKSYEFDVELVAQMPTSMHGSKEGHTGYIYRRKQSAVASTADSVAGDGECCDPLFASAQETVKRGLHAIKAEVDAKVEEKMNIRTKRVPGKRTSA